MKRATRREVDIPALEAIHVYREATQRLEELAQVEKAAGRPLHARHRAQKALIALAAERAEMFDPEPREPSTMVCCPMCVLYRAGV
jgi:hypothetical protein